MIITPPFPALTLANWQPTRDTIHRYSRVLGKIRGALTPAQKHWWHISLLVEPNGLTTTAMPIAGGSQATFTMVMDLRQSHRLTITTSRGEAWEMLMTGQSIREFCDATLLALAELGIKVEIDRSLFAEATSGTYEPAAAAAYCQALTQVDRIFEQFKAELPGETSPVQLWPHHFDLSLTWFSGRKAPGVDPTNEEYADEQMGFGFSTGDEGIPEPYFYITAYPWVDDIVAAPLPAVAAWYTQSWKGALLRYASLVGADQPEEQLLAYLRAAQQAGSQLMQ